MHEQLKLNHSVESLSKMFAGINFQGEDGFSALMKAIQAHDLTMVAFLLEKGVNINSQEEYGDTALMKAVEQQDVAMVRFFIAKGVDVNFHVDGEATVLQNAVYYLNQTSLIHIETTGTFIEILKTLLRSGASTYLPQDILDSIQDVGVKKLLKGLRTTLYETLQQKLLSEMMRGCGENTVHFLDCVLQIVPRIYGWKHDLLSIQDTLNKIYSPGDSRVFQAALLHLQINKARRYQYDPLETAKRVVKQQATCLNESLLKDVKRELSKAIECSSHSFFKNVPNSGPYDGERFIKQLASLSTETFSMLIWSAWREYLSNFLDSRVSEKNQLYVDSFLADCFKSIYTKKALEIFLDENNVERKISPTILS